MYMIFKDNQPVCIVEGKGFKLVIKTLDPLYNIPKTLATSTNFSLTTDISDIYTNIQTQSYLGIAAQFANSTTFTLKSDILGVNDLRERHTSKYLAEKCSDVLRKFSGGDGKLIQEVPTRWNSTFYIQQFFSSHLYVNEILNKNSTATEISSTLCVLDITEVIKVLNPLEAVTRELCGDFYVTSSVIIPMVHILQNKIITNKTTIISSKLKVGLIEQYQNCFSNIESVTSVGIAIIIDPRFKKIYFQLSVALSKALRTVSDKLKKPADQDIPGPSPNLI
ncbi:hypothetical protein AGLY_011055, partial [Aphis glycines]